MSGTAIADPAAVAPDWLTAELRGAGALARGRVARVESSPPRATPSSVVTRLTVAYAPGSDPAAPTGLFLKTPGTSLPPDLGFAVGEREARFYRDYAPAMPAVPLVPCYSAAADRETGRWHVLLLDVDATHTQPPWPLPPTKDECARAVDVLATAHARWWGGELPAPAGADAPRPATPEEHAERLLGGVDAFVAFLGDRLSERRRATFDLVARTFAATVRRRVGSRRLTLAHADAHPWNFLFPRAPGAGPVYLVDWQAWRVWEPATDLAYMLGLQWYPERRARFERPLVSRYHERLVAAGVEGYGWEACWDDYRYAMIEMLLRPVWHWRNGVAPMIWWPHLERATSAFDDLGCAELLGA